MSRSRKLTLLTALLASSLAMTACGSSGSGSSDSGKKTIKIGFQGPLSGDNSQLGINALDGVKTALAEAKAKGDLPFNVDLVTSDDIGKPEQGATAAQRLVDDPSVVAVVGPMFSGATKAAEPTFSGANLLSVSPSATNPQLTSLGFKTFFRVIPPDDAQGQEAANYLSKVVKAKKVYSLDDKSEYGTGLSTVVEAQLKSNGATVVHDGIPPTKNYTAQADKIIAANPDALYYSGYYAEFGLLVKALKGKGFKGVIMSGDGSNDDKFIAAAGQANAEGVLLSCPCGDANVDPNAAAFLASYKKNNNNALPGTYSPEAYDATNAILSVLKALGASSATDRAKVATAFKTVSFKGITKTIAFTPTGEVTAKIVFIYKVTAGKRGVLGTTADLVK
ncbi:MAG: putative branched-chain amino acid transporter [Frankiales bacterium]|nr:putative branched-chain amino acid transporter [Frankiales bacterium]